MLETDANAQPPSPMGELRAEWVEKANSAIRFFSQRKSIIKQPTIVRFARLTNRRKLTPGVLQKKGTDHHEFCLLTGCLNFGRKSTL